MLGVLPPAHYLGLPLHPLLHVRVVPGGPQFIVRHFSLRQGLGIGQIAPGPERLALHLLPARVDCHVNGPVEIALRIGPNINGPLGGVVFIGARLGPLLLHLLDMIAALVVLGPVVIVRLGQLGVAVIVAPVVVPVAALLGKLPCHEALPGVLPQGKAPVIVEQDGLPDHIALIFFHDNLQNVDSMGPKQGRDVK